MKKQTVKLQKGILRRKEQTENINKEGDTDTEV